MPAQSLGQPDLEKLSDWFFDVASKISNKSIPAKLKEVSNARAAGSGKVIIDNLLDELAGLHRSAEACIDISREFDVLDLKNALVDTDITDAMGSLKCASGKALLAIDRIDKTKRVLQVLGQIIELGGKILAAAAAPTLSLAAIKSIIDTVDDLVFTEFKRTLTDQQIKAMEGQLAACT